jgi:hypothetical protein
VYYSLFLSLSLSLFLSLSLSFSLLRVATNRRADTLWELDISYRSTPAAVASTNACVGHYETWFTNWTIPNLWNKQLQNKDITKIVQSDYYLTSLFWDEFVESRTEQHKHTFHMNERDGRTDGRIDSEAVFSRTDANLPPLTEKHRSIKTDRFAQSNRKNQRKDSFLKSLAICLITSRCPYRAFGRHLIAQWIGRHLVAQRCHIESNILIPSLSNKLHFCAFLNFWVP